MSPGRVKLDGGRKDDVAETRGIDFKFGHLTFVSLTLFPKLTFCFLSPSSVLRINMRSVALAVLLTLVASNVSVAEEAKPVFKASFH